MQDLVHHLSRTIAEGRPIGMALALAAMQARTLDTPIDLDLIEPLAADCHACLSDLTCRGRGDVQFPLDPDTTLVLHIVAVLESGYTLDILPLHGTRSLITTWLGLYPPQVRVQRLVTTETAIIADCDHPEAAVCAP